MKEHVAEIVAAYVRQNQLSATELPELIASVNSALASLEEAPVVLIPVVPIGRSVHADAITCLDCGFRAKMLRRHLSSVHGRSLDAYRARWHLPIDYPVVASNYSALRSALAKGLA